MSEKIHIDTDITVAKTLPGKFYDSEKYFNECEEFIFRQSWQFVLHENQISIPGSVHPFSFIDPLIKEPLILVRNNIDAIKCLSNVCTHRGNLLVANDGIYTGFKCRYHGRKFNLDGEFLSMPEFQECKNFNPEEESLKNVRVKNLNGLLFTAVDSDFDLSELAEDIKSRLGWFDFNSLKFDSSLSRDYLVKANWALYVDNYLEGFHIPYVHSGLNAVIDYGNYKSVIQKYSNLQIGYSKGGEEILDIPEGYTDHGSDVAAYYYWLFPNTMLNFYPWGLSINVVKPIKKDLTKVSFLTYVSDESKLGKGAGADLDKVEREDENIVEDVQRGISSSKYDRGRYSPTRERGVHHFHLLISEFLNSD